MATTTTIFPLKEHDLPQASRELLRELENASGRVSNFALTTAHSRAALEALNGLTHAASQTALSERARSAIALRVAQLNGCEYCVASHTEHAAHLGLDDASIMDYRRGVSKDPREQTLLSLATKIVEDRGHHAGFAIHLARQVGVSDAEIVEVVQLISLSVFSNYLNNLACTELDVSPVDLTLPTIADLCRENRNGSRRFR